MKPLVHTIPSKGSGHGLTWNRQLYGCLRKAVLDEQGGVDQANNWMVQGKIFHAYAELHEKSRNGSPFSGPCAGRGLTRAGQGN